MTREKEEIQLFKSQVSKSKEPMKQFANRFLSKRLWQYKKVRLGKSSNKLLTYADIYRNLDLFVTEVCDTMDEMKDEMVKEAKRKPTEIFFPEVEKKLVLGKEEDGEDMYAAIEDMTTTIDWKKALAQRKQLGSI